MVTEGLTTAEAQKRARAQGPNTLEYRPPRSTWSRLVTQFRNPLIIVLLVAGVVTAIVGDYIDSVVIFAVVVINALIGWIQEGRAQRALESVSALLVTEATVIRDGRRQVIDAADIVRGAHSRFVKGVSSTTTSSSPCSSSFPPMVVRRA